MQSVLERKEAKKMHNHKRAFRRYRNNYGLSVEGYTQMLLNQSGLCGICNEQLVGRTALDHDHKTGRLREILCWHCNVMLGQAKDKTDILIRGAEYLKKYQPQ